MIIGSDPSGANGRETDRAPACNSGEDMSDSHFKPIATAPFDCDLELAVIDASGEHALVFPCRRVLNGWVDGTTGKPIAVRPTHWRKWASKP